MPKSDPCDLYHIFLALGSFERESRPRFPLKGTQGQVEVCTSGVPTPPPGSGFLLKGIQAWIPFKRNPGPGGGVYLWTA